MGPIVAGEKILVPPTPLSPLLPYETDGVGLLCENTKVQYLLVVIWRWTFPLAR